MQRFTSACLPLLALFLILTCCASEPAPPEPMRVMSFNIRYGNADDGEDSWQYRREKTAQVIADYAPDVLGLQESLHIQRDQLLEMLPGYNSFGVGRDDGISGEECAVLYNSERFILTAGGTFWLSEEPGLPGSVSWDSSLTRCATWLRLYEPATQRGFYVFNTHFDHRGEQARLESAKLVLERIGLRDEAEPVLLLGDLNCAEGSAPIELLGRELTDTYRVIHPDETAVRTFHGFTGRTDGGKIDYVYADAAWEVLDANIIHDSYEGNYPSDHYPLVATVKLAE